MRIATAPVNWNNADVADYRPWTPYPALLDEMVAAAEAAHLVRPARALADALAGLAASRHLAA